MCKTCNRFNPIHCIVPPYMVDKIRAATLGTRSAFAAAVKTEFNDTLFRQKRSLLTGMNAEEYKPVMKAIALEAATPARESSIVAMGSPPKSRHTAVAPIGPNREIYTLNNSNRRRDLPGKLLRKEGGRASSDKDANLIYDNCGHTWDFYFSILKRNSIDRKGLTMINTIHFGDNYENAFWEGTQMVYGDGGEVFKSFTQDIDITGHELTHGVVQYEAQLKYEFESGAINESMADVFGMLIKQYVKKEDAKKSTWHIGETCMRGKGYVLRSMSKPGYAYRNHPILKNDPQPGHMKQFKRLPNTELGDWGGVHINSGIPNHAFYIFAYDLGGNAWEKAGKVWYAALCDLSGLNPNSTFKDLKLTTIKQCEKLFGLGSTELKKLKGAWKQVGL